MQKFVISHYKSTLKKIKGEGVTFAVITDLHGLQFGENNCRLLEAVRRIKPDAVLAVGDLSVNYSKQTYRDAAGLLTKLAEDFPVIYAYGNHEGRMCREELAFMERYEKCLTRHGVHLLRNSRFSLSLKGTEFVFYGLEIPMDCYRKPFSKKMTLEQMRCLLGDPQKNGVQVLLAHSPQYGKLYFDWGADVIFCGHYHGGVVRFTRHRGLISSQFRLFPPYCCGDFHRKGRHMFVSAGMGEHTIPLRIHNPRELLTAEFGPEPER